MKRKDDSTSHSHKSPDASDPSATTATTQEVAHMANNGGSHNDFLEQGALRYRKTNEVLVYG